ncbi:MAG: M28 family peptidase [Deltaproteobacteria bacterium]|nr:M28 family peptidase [Deltaproteobacteria bacterium]MBW2071417.1 M28 family peptidase [Deltaproteobacteria bacterium]
MASTLIHVEETAEQLRQHLHTLTVAIGERSVRLPENLARTRDYIISFYQDLGLPVETEQYQYRDLEVANVICRLQLGDRPAAHYIVGAHYDSVWGTVGADDNASAIAVQLETARELLRLSSSARLSLQVTFVSFALEEPPAYGTRYMGSRVYAKAARKRREQIDGMLCLEMVGYTCQEPGCQSYPFPLMFMNYPDQGNFVGLVGNLTSRGLTRSLWRAFKKNNELPVISLTVPLGGWVMPSVRLSDHASFWDQGYPAVMITDSAFYRNPHYHQPSDTMEKLDLRFMAELVKSLLIFFREVGS